MQYRGRATLLLCCGTAVIGGATLLVVTAGDLAARGGAFLPLRCTPQVQPPDSQQLCPFPPESSCALMGSRPQSLRRPLCHRRSRMVVPPVFQDLLLISHGAGPRTIAGFFAGFLELLVHSTLWMAFSLSSMVPFVQLSCASISGVSSTAAVLRVLDWRPFWTGLAESVAVYSLDHLRDIQKLGRDTKSRGEQRGDASLSAVAATGFRRSLLRVLFAVALASFCGSLASARSWRVTATFMGHLALCIGYAGLKKKMPFFKAVYVSLCVVFMAIMGPAAYAPGLLKYMGASALWRLCGLIFCVAFTVEHLQDLRDVDEDREIGVVTLPSGLGVERAGALLVAVQTACVLLHLLVGILAGLPPRLDMLAVYALCCLCARSFGTSTPRSLFQIALEPLYVTPLVALLVQSAVRAPL